eukprot:948352-Rhodomonas_salina.1
MFGGKDEGDVHVGDFFEFDAGRMRWTELTDAVGGTAPSRRANVGMAAVDTRLYVFGGVKGFDGEWSCTFPCDSPPSGKQTAPCKVDEEGHQWEVRKAGCKIGVGPDAKEIGLVTQHEGGHRAGRMG